MGNIVNFFAQLAEDCARIWLSRLCYVTDVRCHCVFDEPMLARRH